MSTPKYYEMYNLFLGILSSGEIVTLSDCKERIKQIMNLTEEELSENTNKKGEPIFGNRVGWCATYLKHAGLVFSPKNGLYQITEEGKKLYNEAVAITDKLLRERYPSFTEFKSKNNKGKNFDKPDNEQIRKETNADNDLIESIQDTLMSVDLHKVITAEIKKERAEPITISEKQVYPRNRIIAINALSRADFSCEINNEHPSFRRRSMECQYTEPHHLVPMAYQNQFDVSLDVEQNIVSLCCTCHREIHYGANAKRIVKQLYKMRKESLKSAGIVITLSQLMDMYE